jgi:O-antigen/teichoic acid export membrane protein
VAGVNAIATATVARVLGVGQFGQYAAALGTVTMLLVLCDLGFSSVLGRELAASVDEKGRLLRAAVRAQTVVAAAVTVAIVVIAIGIGVTTIRGEVLLAMTPVVALSALGVYRLIFIVTFDVGFLARVDVVANVVIQGTMIGVAVLSRTAVSIAVAYSAGTITAALVVAWVGNHRLDQSRASRRDVWPLARRAFPFGVNSIVTSAYFTIDLVLLQFLVGPHQLGDYAAACKFLSIMVTLPGILLSAALPAWSIVMTNHQDRSTLTARLTHWLAVTALPLNIGLCVFAGTAVRIAFGGSYSGAVPLLRILAGAGALGCLLSPLGMATVALALNRQQMIASVVALTFNVAGNVLLVPLAGVTASAWLTLATDAVAGSMIAFILRKKIAFRLILRTLGKPLMACGALAAVGLALSGVPAIGLPASAVAYVMVLSLMGGWPEEFSGHAARHWRKWRPGDASTSV